MRNLGTPYFTFSKYRPTVQLLFTVIFSLIDVKQAQQATAVCPSFLTKYNRTNLFLKLRIKQYFKFKKGLVGTKVLISKIIQFR